LQKPDVQRSGGNSTLAQRALQHVTKRPRAIMSTENFEKALKEIDRFN